jgi:hypothetical protein
MASGLARGLLRRPSVLQEETMRNVPAITLFALLSLSLVGCSDATPAAHAAEQKGPEASSRSLRVEAPVVASAVRQPEAAPPVQPAPSAPALPGSPAPLPGGESMSLLRFSFAQAIEAREPVGASDVYAPGSKVYAFLELANKHGAATALFVKFEREGERVAGPAVRLSVPTMARYRTQAYTSNTKKPGRYTCTISMEDGTVLLSKQFTIQEATFATK